MKFPVFSLLAGNLAFSETSSQLTPPSSGESRANLIPRGPVSNASCPRPVQLPNPAPLTRPYIKWFASDPAGMFDAPLPIPCRRRR